MAGLWTLFAIDQSEEIACGSDCESIETLNASVLPRSLSRTLSTRNVPGLAGLLLFISVAVLPVVFSLGYAAAYSLGLVGLLSDGFTLEHWALLATPSEIWFSFGWSLYVAGATVALTLGLALPLALGLRRTLQDGPLGTILYFPLAIPATVAAFLVFQWFSGAGYAARIAYHAGFITSVQAFPDLVNDPWAIGIILAHVGLAVPFFTLLFRQIYVSEHIDRLLQVAGALGGTRRQHLARVALPILWHKARTNVVLFFIAVLGSYEIPLLLGQQSPQMVSVLTMRKYSLFDVTDKPEAFILACP